MKLSIRNTFSCDPATLWEVFDSPEFDARLEAESGVVRELLSESMDGDIEVRVLRCISKKELPGFMAKAMGSKHLEYNQTSRFNPATNVLEWNVVPTVMAERVTAKGRTEVTVTGDQCLRVINGEIRVRLPLIGGRIEKKLMEEIGSGYERAAEIAKSLIAARNK